MKSRSALSAQWMSSNTMTEGPASAIRSKKMRQAANRFSSITGPPVFQSEQVREPGCDEAPLRLVDHVLLHRCPELRHGRRGFFVLEDPGAAPDHLGECPERDALPVGQATTLVPPDVVDQPVDVLVQLPDQPGLPDAADPLHGYEVDLPVVGGVVEELLDQTELSVATRERWFEHRRSPGRLPETDDRDGSPELHGLGLALQLEDPAALVRDHVVGRSHRRLAHEDGAGVRDRLDAGGGIDQVPGDHPLTLGVERDRRLAGQDAGAGAEVRRADLLSERSHDGRELEGSPHGTFGIVLVRDRRPPDGHDRIADELLHDAAVAADDLATRVEIARQEISHLFGIARFREGREPHEVGEQHRHQAPFGRGGGAGNNRRGRRDRPPQPQVSFRKHRRTSVRAGSGSRRNRRSA